MSQSLIRRGLDLYKDDVHKKGSSSKLYKKNGIVDEEKLTSLVGTNKQGYRKKLKRLHTKRNDTTLKDKKVKPHENLSEMYTRKDMTGDNLKALQLMGLLNKDEKKVMEQAAQRHQEKSDKQRYRKNKDKDAASKAAAKEEASSVFTETDFEKFFKEYNFT